MYHFALRIVTMTCGPLVVCRLSIRVYTIAMHIISRPF